MVVGCKPSPAKLDPICMIFYLKSTKIGIRLSDYGSAESISRPAITGGWPGADRSAGTLCSAVGPPAPSARDLSFSLYMTHGAEALRPEALRQSSDGRSPFLVLGGPMAALVACMVIAALTNRLIEAPGCKLTLRLADALRRRRPATAARPVHRRKRLRCPGEAVRHRDVSDPVPQRGTPRIRITGAEGKLLQVLTATTGAEAAPIGVRGFIPKWRAMVDENEYYSFEIAL